MKCGRALITGTVYIQSAYNRKLFRIDIVSLLMAAACFAYKFLCKSKNILMKVFKWHSSCSRQQCHREKLTAVTCWFPSVSHGVCSTFFFCGQLMWGLSVATMRKYHLGFESIARYRVIAIENFTGDIVRQQRVGNIIWRCRLTATVHCTRRDSV